VPSSLLQLAVLVSLIALTAIVLSDRRALFWLTFVATFVPIGFVDRYYLKLPAPLKWFPYGCIAFAGLGALVLLPGLRARVPRGLLLAWAGLLAVSLASLLINQTSFPTFLVAQRSYVIVFAAVLAFGAARSFLGREELHALLVKTGLVSCAVCVIQRVLLVSSVDGPDPGDRVTGLFPVGYIALFFHLSCVGIVIAYWIRGRRILAAPPSLVLAAFVIAMGVANQKAALFYLVALLGFLLLRSGAFATRGGRGRLLFASIALPVIALVIFAPIYDRAYERRATDSFSELITDPAYIERYLFGDEKVQFTPAGRLLRGRAIVFAWELTSSDPLHLLLGLGPGASSESRLAGASGALTQRYPGYAIDRTGLSMMIADTGLLGVAMHLAFFVAILAWRPPESELEAGEHRLVRELFVFLAAAWTVYGNLYYEPVFALWVAVAVYPIGIAPKQRQLP
jgi:hypothetical protein